MSTVTSYRSRPRPQIVREIPEVDRGCGVDEYHEAIRCQNCGTVVAQLRVEYATWLDANLVTVNVACPKCRAIVTFTPL